jgi:hypothetical protein
MPCNFEVNLITRLGVIALDHPRNIPIGPVVSEKKLEM